MRNILLVGKSDLACYYLEIVQKYTNMNILDKKTINSQKSFEDIDYIFNFASQDLNDDLKLKVKESKTVIFQKSQLTLMKPFIAHFTQQFENLELILDNIRDGLIVIDDESNIQFLNRSAKEILALNTAKNYYLPIEDIIKNSELPNVLKKQEKEINMKFSLNGEREIITTRIPLVNKHKHLIGAFAIFKETNEIVKLAEENTDLKEIKTMLEAIIKSSDEAISVVDENGLGLMINPAYTRITGLNEKDVIGQPASVDISEGKSMHYQVLSTRRPVRGARMKVGPEKKEVIVNVAPIIVHGKLKGSVAVIQDVSEVNELTTALKQAKQMIRNLEATYTFDDIIGSSSEMRIAVEQAKIGAKTPATVLLRGKSGTGKELFAHAIHNESNRKYHKFIRVNCAALSESILESELFGYEDGAFTGAKTGGKKGYFEEANNGTIFLDEIGEVSLNIQVKLLRVLQEQEIVRVGGTTPISLNVRIITATNKNLEKAIQNQSFREDLYYRLNRLPIFIPELKDRISDLPELVNRMILKVNQLYGRNINDITDEALEKLSSYHWPGNVRELENVISRSAIFMGVQEKTIEVKHLPILHHSEQEIRVLPEQATEQTTLQEATEVFEKKFIKDVFNRCQKNKTNTARELNISVRSLYYKLEKYDIT